MAKENSDKPKDSFFYMRANPQEKAKWVRAAQRAKKDLAAWATEQLNDAAQCVVVVEKGLIKRPSNE